MTPGESTVRLVEQLTNEGVKHIVLLMRHSAREYAPGKHDLLNPLTDEGRSFARGPRLRYRPGDGQELAKKTGTARLLQPR